MPLRVAARLGDASNFPPPPRQGASLSLFVWTMIGIAFWHFVVFLPDRFWGGIIGAFAASTGGALAAGYLLPTPGLPTANPPGIEQALIAIPGSLAGLVACYVYGARRERESG